MSGMRTFGLLVVLIDCLNGQSIPTHPDRVMIKTKSRATRITCNVDSSTLQSSVIHWYRAQPGGAFQRLMYFEAGSKKAVLDSGVPRRFSGSVRNQQVSLSISALQFDDAGSYYCALWTGDNYWIKRFGTGTRLIVTDSNADTVKKPNLTGYLPFKKTSGKQAMLCQARDMFPDLVKIIWQKKSSTGDWTYVPGANILEQRNEKEKVITAVTSMMTLDEPPAEDDLYKCTAIHEGGSDDNHIELKKDNKVPVKKPPKAITNTTCQHSTEESFAVLISDTPEQMRRLYVFIYAYGVMLMKNGVYFCAVSIFLLKRKYGKKEESS